MSQCAIVRRGLLQSAESEGRAQDRHRLRAEQVPAVSSCPYLQLAYRYVTTVGVVVGREGPANSDMAVGVVGEGNGLETR
jgi:hypothetical protein